MKRILHLVLCLSPLLQNSHQQHGVCMAFNNNNNIIIMRNSNIVMRKRLLNTARVSHQRSSPSSISVFNAMNPAVNEIDPLDAKIQKEFHPGPEVSIGSLKLNIFGVLFGIIGVSLGFLWWLGLAFCQLFQFVTRQKFDPYWRLPVEVSHLWGTLTLRLTNCYPVITGKENLKEIYKKDKETGKANPVRIRQMKTYFVFPKFSEVFSERGVPIALPVLY